MKPMFNKMKYYSLKNILSKNAQYNIIFGERSNGKSYAVLKYGIEAYAKTGEQMAIVRRWREDFRGKRGQALFSPLVENGVISRVTNGKYDNVYYYAGKWYFSKFDEELNKNVIDENPFAWGFALTEMEHDKSTSYPKITTILFDEFLTRNAYLPDEFVLFMNVVSTIVRYRDNVKIFMLGNTVNQYCPYFNEMGLKHISKMEKGDIDVYSYGDSKLRVAVEYADSPNKGKPSDIYFAFNADGKSAAKLDMITGGVWEMALYPHCPVKYKPKEILFTYFIQFDGNLLQCEIVQHEQMIFTFIHRKTTPLKNEEKDFLYTTEYSPQPNISRRLTRPLNNIEKRIWYFFSKEKVFYQDNEVGEIVRNYINWSNTETIK